MGCTSLKTLSLAAAAGLTMMATSAQAQGQGNAAPVCDAYDAPLEEGGENYLQIVCDGVGVVLGSVDEHRVVQLPSLKSVVVLTSLGGTRRAWLVMRDDEDVALEEITGTIARLAGRGARRDISGLELDFEALNTGRMTAAIRSGDADAVDLDLQEMIERSRSVRGNAAAGGAN